MFINIFNKEKARTLPQQVQKNKDDIERLKKVLKDYYYTEENIDNQTESIEVSKTDYNGPMDKTAEGYLLSQNGNFYKIISVAEELMYIKYWFNVKGEPGIDGQEGPAGQNGKDGASCFIDDVSAVELPAGNQPTVENTGTASNARFVFGIPAGQPGTNGKDGVGVKDVQVTPGSSSDEGETYNVEVTYTDETQKSAGDIFIPVKNLKFKKVFKRVYSSNITTPNKIINTNLTDYVPDTSKQYLIIVSAYFDNISGDENTVSNCFIWSDITGNSSDYDGQFPMYQVAAPTSNKRYVGANTIIIPASQSISVRANKADLLQINLYGYIEL